MKNYYQILGIERGEEDYDIIRGAYRDRLMQLRLDINTDEITRNKFEELQEAWGIMKDSWRRSNYRSRLLDYEFISAIRDLTKEMNRVIDDTLEMVVGKK